MNEITSTTAAAQTNSRLRDRQVGTPDEAVRAGDRRRDQRRREQDERTERDRPAPGGPPSGLWEPPGEPLPHGFTSTFAICVEVSSSSTS